MVSVPGFCDACGSPIVWSETENGKRMPVDKHTSSEGTCVYRKGRVHVLTKAELEEIPENQCRYSVHFATCKTRVKSNA